MAGRISGCAAMLLAVAASAFAIPAEAEAQNGAQLLASFQGNWRGSGQTRPNPQSKPVRVTCKISASFDAASESLVNKGRCGSTQGTRKLAGTLKASGDRLTGSFLGSVAAPGMTNQRLRIAGGMIIAEAEMETSGKVLKMRTLFTPPEDGAFKMESQFYDYARKDWVVAGQIEFKKE